MRLLAMDSASDACSAAIWVDGRIAARRHVAMARGHAEALMPMVTGVLADSGMEFDALDGIAVTVGPGSFTGLRTGLAAARGLALACGLPVAGVTTLETVAYAALQEAQAARQETGAADRNCLVALETRRADLYVQLFSATGEALGAPEARTPSDAAAMLPRSPVLIAGNGAARLLQALPGHGADFLIAPGDGNPDAAAVASLVAQRWARDGKSWSGMAPSPLYVHPPQATLPPREGRLRP